MRVEFVIPCLVMFLVSSSIIVGSCCVCIPITERGISSRCVRTVKCHDFILIRSSKVNSKYRRPSVHTYEQIQFYIKTNICMYVWRNLLIRFLAKHKISTFLNCKLTLVYNGFPWCVTIVHCSHSSEILVLWKDSLVCFIL